MTEDKWTNLQGFLRRLFSLGEDMKYLSKGFDKAKKQEAEDLIEKFKKKVKASDKPAKAKDLPLFLAGEPEITGYLEKFQDYLYDAGADIEAEEDDELQISSFRGKVDTKGGRRK